MSPSPVHMENIVLRQQLGLSFRQVDNNNGSTAQRSSSAARCLFGAPDPKVAMDLVREVELKNALSFGKKFNFDIVQGEPFPACGKSSVLEKDNSDLSLDSDEENVDAYMWRESYDEDYMSKCHESEEIPMGPSHHPVSLLFAPIISQTSYLTSSSSDKCQQQKTETPSVEIKTSYSNKKKYVLKNGSLHLKRNNLLNSLHHHGNHPKTGKKTSLAQQIITKYTYANRVIKHALKKPRKSITGRPQPRENFVLSQHN